MKTSKETFVNKYAAHIPAERFNRLRKEGKLLDIVIVVSKILVSLNLFYKTENQQEIAAHRLVLCTQFPKIEEEIVRQDSGRLEWTEFSPV